MPHELFPALVSEWVSEWCQNAFQPWCLKASFSSQKCDKIWWHIYLCSDCFCWVSDQINSVPMWKYDTLMCGQLYGVWVVRGLHFQDRFRIFDASESKTRANKYNTNKSLTFLFINNSRNQEHNVTLSHPAVRLTVCLSCSCVQCTVCWIHFSHRQYESSFNIQLD